MEDIKTTKINNAAADLPEVKRTVTGEIDLEAISTGKNEKGNYIVPDNIMAAYYKELPNGTVNESRTFTAYNKGLLKALDEEIRRKGAEALNAEKAQRRKISETISLMLSKRANSQYIEKYNLEAGSTNQDVMVAAMLEKAMEQKDVQAFNSIRDTVGEKPATEVNATLEEITPEDKELLQRVNARLNSNT